jgi:hypothetical protein
VTNKLGSQVNVVGAGTKADDQYSAANIKTKVSQDADGTTSIDVMMDKNITGDSVTVGGKDGKDGVNGSIGVKGADGTDGVTVYATNGTDGTQGHIGLTGAAGKDGKDATADITVANGANGVDGTDGHNGTDGMDRVTYTDHNDVTHEVATLDDGLKFKGDNDTVIAKKLNETMDIKGGADSTKLTDGNIGVVAENGALNVKLAKDLKNLDSVTTGDTVINTNGMTVTNGPTITKTTVDVAGNKITNVKDGDVTSTSTDAVNGSQLKKYTDAAKTEVLAGSNVDSVTLKNDDKDKHAIYTVNVKDMTVKSGSVTYGNDGTGTATLTNGNGTTATITGLKNTYTTSGTLNDTTETFTRNDGTSYSVDLSSLAGNLSNKGLKFGANSGAVVTNKLGSQINVMGAGTKADTSYSGKNLKTVVSQGEDGNTTINVLMDNDIDANSVKVGKDGADGTPGKDGVSITGPSGTAGVDGVDGKVGITGADGKDAVSISGKDGVGHIGLTGAKGTDGKDGASADITVANGANGVDGTDGHNGTDGMDRVTYTDHNDVTHEVATLDDGLKFKGDNDTVIAKKLNETMDIKGGADSTKLTDGNIGVVAENGALNVKLAKELTDLTSVTAGDTTINTNGMTVTGGPTITKTKVDVNNQKITNVADGDVSSTSKDAINGSQLKSYTDAATTKVTNGSNTTVKSTTNTDGSTTYTVDLANTITVGDTNPVTVNGTKGTVTGLTNTDWNNGNPVGYSVDRAATEGELTGVETDLTNKGLKFGANSGDAVTNKLGSQVNVVGAGTKADDQYSAANIKTKVSQDADGTTSIDVMMDKDITGNSVTVGGAGKDGAAGVDGSIGVKGTDGTNGVTVYATNGKDGKDGTEGHIGLTGANGADADVFVKNGKVGVDGTDGNNGKDGMDRVTYTDHNDVTHEVATLDDGMKYGGDTGNTIALKLNSQLDVKGGITDTTKLTDNNIGVVSDGTGTLNVKLAKDLKGLTSTTYVDENGQLGTTINNKGVTIENGDHDVSLTKTGLDNGDNKITNVAAGTNDTDAVNYSQLTKAAAAAKTEVKQGANVTVTSEIAKDDNHVTYTVAADDMRVKSGTATYDNNGTGSIAVTNNDGTTATISGLKNTYTTAGTLKGTTETFTRNDGTSYDVDLSSLSGDLSNKGLQFAANSGDAVTNKLGSKVTIAGAGTKADTSYSGKNLKTVVSQGEDGNTTINVLMDNDIDANSVKVGKDGADGTPGKDGVSITGPSGTAGVDGVDGKVGITGADGKDAVSISGKDGVGHIGLTGAKGTDGKDGASADITVANGANGVDGTDGHNGTDGMDRVTYTDHNDVTHEVATLDDGLKFKGDNDTVIAKKLNETMDIKGGADSTKLTEGNIGVVAENGALNVKLAKDLKNLDSVTTGDTVINTNGMTVTNGPTITKTTVDVAGNKITNVKAGDVTSDSTDAINGSQLKKYTDAATTKVTNGSNTTVKSTTNADGSTTYTVDLANTIKVGDTHPVTVNGTDGTVTGLTNTDWNNGNPVGYSVDRAATEGELTGVETDLTNKGLKFGANSGTAVTNKLGSQVNVVGEGTKADTEYSGTNIKTKVSQNEDGTTNIDVMLDKNLTGDSVTVGGAGKDGAAGVDGKIGVKGIDGTNGVTVYATNGKDGKDGTEGHIGLTGANGADADVFVKNGKVGVDGTDGNNGKDGMDRVTYTDHNDVTHEVATLDDGMKYGGDTGNTIALKLNSQLDVKGGITDTTKLTDNNIGVVSDGMGTLNVKLAKDLKGLTSTTYVDENGQLGTTINNKGVTIENGDHDVSLTKTGLDNGDNKITNVAAGTNDTDAVNYSQLTKAAAAAKTEVKQGANITVTSEIAKDDNHVTYTVAADDMRVKNGTATYDNNGTGSIAVTNNDGTTATISGLKNTYTASGTLSGTTETFTRNDGTSYDVDLSGLTDSLTNKGLKFGANSGTAVTNKLGSQVNVVGEGTKADTEYSGTNIKTKVSQNEDGTTNIDVMLDKNITGDSVTVGGKDGKDGVNGTIGVKGADGKDGVNAYATNGKDGTEGHIGLTGLAGKDGKDAKADITVTEGKVGVDGTDGKNGKDGMDRVTYTDHNDVTHEVATLDDGMKYGGDTGNTIALKLNSQLDVKGGITDTTKLTDNNIGVVSDGTGTLNVKLAKDLKGLTSTTYVDENGQLGTTINNKGVTIENGDHDVSLTKTGLDNGGNTITNVAKGVNGTDAVNVDQLTKATQDMTDKGLKFGANSGKAVTNKLGSLVNVVGEGTKADTEYSGTNIKTKVSQNEDGTTNIDVMMDKNLTGDSVTVGGAGKDGAPGVNGSIGVKGSDGTDGVTAYATNGTNGTEGHIGLTGVKGTDGKDAKADITVQEGKVGVDGTDGKNGKDGMDRLEYTDHNDVTHEVATLDDGMKYGGDTGDVIALKLNSQLNIKGGITDTTKLTDNNIGVVSDGTGTLNVKLAKDLKGLTSTTYVDENGQLGTTINNTGVTIENGDNDVSLTKNGLDNGGNTITNVAKGVNGTDAVNVDQLKEETAKATTKVADGTNTNVTSEKNADGSTTYHVNLNPSITLGTDPTKQVSIDGTKGTITAGTGDNAVTIDGTDATVKAGKVTVDGTAGTVTGLTNTTWVPGVTTAVSGRAATEDQLKSVSDVAYQASKQHTTVDNKDGNITIAQGTNKDGGINYTLGLKDNINVGGTNGSDGSIGVNGKDGSNGVTISAKTGDDGVEGHIGLTGAKGADGTSTTADVHVIAGQAGVNGKDGDTMTRVVYEDKDKTTHEIATTDDGMKYSGDTGSAAVKLDKNVSIVGETASGSSLTTGNIGVEASQDGDNAKLVVKLSDNLTGIKNITTETMNATTVNATTVKAGDTVTINNTGIDMGGTKVTNLKAGDISSTSTDAVNGSQLYQTDVAVNHLGNSLSNLDSRVNKVGAGAAALAALHPLDFDPDEKWDFAAGYGHYKGANAGSVGAFYRPNEDTMFSIGGTVGNGENMINAGVSFKLGQGNHISTSRVAMAKEIKDLHKEVEELRGLLVNACQGKQLDSSKMKLFPDIPANHWAYEAIKVLAGNGIVEGYPDGNFSGDRMMTRYEFAMIVYRAMQKGANVSDKLLNEFEPELERIRVDVVAKDKNGTPTIERVRVIPGRG